MDPLTVLKRKRRFLIHAKPNSKKTKLIDYDEAGDFFIVTVNARPEDGKANTEIEKYFSRLLGKSVRIKSGHTGKKKILEAR